MSNPVVCLPLGRAVPNQDGSNRPPTANITTPDGQLPIAVYLSIQIVRLAKVSVPVGFFKHVCQRCKKSLNHHLRGYVYQSLANSGD